jgi:PAS domain S-box-containing protein
MESDILNKTTNQLLIQHISEAAVFTNPRFAITACNTTASNLFLYNQQELLGLHLSFLVSTSSEANSHLPSIINTTFTGGIIDYIDRTGKIISLYTTRHAIAPDSANGGYLFIYKPLDTHQNNATTCHWPGEYSNTAVIIFNKTFDCLDANTNACQFTGYNRQELILLNLHDLVHFDELNCTMPDMTVLGSGQPVVLERKLRAKDGTARYAEFTFLLMYDERILSFISDITKCRKMQLALQQSEERHRLLFLQSPLPMFVMDLKTFYFLDVNEAAITCYGYSKQEFLELRALDIRSVEDHEKFYAHVKTHSTGLVSMGLCRHIKKNGSMIDVDLYSHDFLYNEKNARLILAIDITEKLEAIREFRKTTAQLRQLSDHLLNIRETERTNIAREIHDELGQQLTILKMDISWLNQKLQKYEDASVLEKTADTLKLLNETIKSVRRIATELRPSMLDDLGLIEALEWQSKEFEKRSGITITFITSVSHLPVTNAVATSLFRIYQEALTNIARHANAKTVFSKLQVANDQVILTITDDGAGFDMQSLGFKKTLGLLGMKERTLMIGGRFEINSKAGKGTTIVVTTSLQLNDAANSKTDQ